MESKTRLITSCTMQRENPENLVMSRKINTNVAHPIGDSYFFPLMSCLLT